jgi:hypothetical protein
MKKLPIMVLNVCILSAGLLFAQNDSTTLSNDKSELEEKVDDLKGKIDGLQEDYLATKPTVEKLAKIKVSGYLQAQIRVATDTSGQLNTDYTNKYDIGEFQGGKFPAATRSVFQVRRARIKTAYETALTQMVIQLDCLPFTTGAAVTSASQATDTSKKVSTKTGAFLTGGGVSIKDAYLRFTEPWLKSIAIKAGVGDRPFGYEISYSSSVRESPERSRLFQTLFPGERDLGFSIEYQPSDNLPAPARCFNFKGGMFAGNGINVEFDDLRDFIGRIGVTIPVTAANISIDGGFSAYSGAVRDRVDSLYETKDNKWVGTKGHLWKDIDRQYFGGDVELFYGDLPLFGGVCLRGELIQGTQPSTKGSNVSQKSDIIAKEPIYLRDISGFYGMAILNIDPIKCQLVGKYDVFDPNTNLEGSKVTNGADIKYSTVGGGLIYHWDENVKLMAYYDKVHNETTSVALFNKDVNDNVFTFRIQYKF